MKKFDIVVSTVDEVRCCTDEVFRFNTITLLGIYFDTLMDVKSIIYFNGCIHSVVDIHNNYWLFDGDLEDMNRLDVKDMNTLEHYLYTLGSVDEVK